MKAHEQLQRLTHLVPSILAIRGGCPAFAAVRIDSDGWAGVTDGHRLARVKIEECVGKPREIVIDGLRMAVKRENTAIQWLAEGEAHLMAMPDLAKIKPVGIYAHWLISEGAESGLEGIIRDAKLAYREERRDWVDDYAAQAAALRERTKEANDALRAVPKAKRGDKEAKRVRDLAKLQHGAERGQIERETRAMQSSRVKTEPTETFGVKMVSVKTVEGLTVLEARSKWGDVRIATLQLGELRKPIGVDARYLLQAIQGMRGNGVILSTARADPFAVLKVTPKGDDTAYALVMPMRL